MADKLTRFVIDAVTRAAADPAGVPLFGTKADPGLFPPAAAAKPAAKKAVDDGLLAVASADASGKGRDRYAATDKGLQFLLDHASPKQVLEDFVRVLEQREGQVTELVAAAGRMADSLAGLRAVVGRVLPRVEAGRVPGTQHPVLSPQPIPPRVPPTADRLGGSAMTATVLEAPAVATADADDLAGAVLARLSDWAASAAAGQDCPLPELFRSLSTRETPPTIGSFHDCLRHLHDARRVYLHPWTGPLYAMPEPACALLVGHEVAYYASSRS